MYLPVATRSVLFIKYFAYAAPLFFVKVRLSSAARVASGFPVNVSSAADLDRRVQCVIILGYQIFKIPKTS